MANYSDVYVLAKERRPDAFELFHRAYLQGIPSVATPYQIPSSGDAPPVMAASLDDALRELFNRPQAPYAFGWTASASARAHGISSVKAVFTPENGLLVGLSGTGDGERFLPLLKNLMDADFGAIYSMEMPERRGAERPWPFPEDKALRAFHRVRSRYYTRLYRFIAGEAPQVLTRRWVDVYVLTRERRAETLSRFIDAHLRDFEPPSHTYPLPSRDRTPEFVAASLDELLQELFRRPAERYDLTWRAAQPQDVLWGEAAFTPDKHLIVGLRVEEATAEGTLHQLQQLMDAEFGAIYSMEKPTYPSRLAASGVPWPTFYSVPSRFTYARFYRVVEGQFRHALSVRMVGPSCF